MSRPSTTCSPNTAHPEAKSFGPDGNPCDEATIGLLGRRRVKIASSTRDGQTISAITYIGKEANKLLEVASGLLTSLDDALNEYQDPSKTFSGSSLEP